MDNTAITASRGTDRSTLYLYLYQFEPLLALVPRPNFDDDHQCSSPQTAPIRPPSSYPIADSIWKPMFDRSSLGAGE